MAVGNSAFTPLQRDRLHRALAVASEETGLPFSVAIGNSPADGPDLATEAHNYVMGFGPGHGGVVIMIDPTARRLEIATSGSAARRIPDRSVGLTVLSMTSRIGVGDVLGAIVDGIRMLAETAGRGEGSYPGIDVGTATTPAHAHPALPHGH